MHIPPLTSLAMSMSAQKGMYALLLGSGVSRTAGIPTGWGIVLDLVGRLAKAQGADCGSDQDARMAWFVREFGVDPNYSTLLQSVAPTSVMRMSLLKGYFEPTDDERERQEKRPTKAHEEIAKLVAAGHIRVILTTNFDRLLEQALKDVGIEPTVVCNAHQAAGAPPFHRNSCTIYKLHGDYLDTRIRNTPDELAAYEPEIASLLDRLLDDHGLVICGWSATWDPALRDALQRRKGRRFPTYWVDSQPLSGLSLDLRNHLAAEAIVETADKFFEGLGESVSALDDSAQHPITAEIAVARLKRYLLDSRFRIRLHDLVMDEVNAAHGYFTDDDQFPATLGRGRPYEATVERYVARMSVVLRLAATGARWSTSEHHELWCSAMRALLREVREETGDTSLLGLRRFPALLLFYALGIGAMCSEDAERYLLVRKLFHLNVLDPYDRRKPASALLYPTRVLHEIGLARMGEKGLLSRSNFLYPRLRAVFQSQLPNERAFEEQFDRWEILLGVMFCADRNAYLGRFARFHYMDEHATFVAFRAEFETHGAGWGPVAAGLFSEEAAKAGFQELKKRAESLW